MSYNGNFNREANAGQWREQYHGRRVLVIGDNRVEDLKTYTTFQQAKNVRFCFKDGANHKDIIEMGERELTSNEGRDLDVIVLFALHSDFSTWKSVNNYRLLVADTPDVNAIVYEILGAILSWQERFPQVTTILTVPFIPDFQAYNRGKVTPAILAELDNNKCLRQYLNATNQFLTTWFTHVHVRPFCLTDLSRGNRKVAVKPRAADDPRPFRGPTKDGLNVSQALTQTFWTLFFKNLRSFMEGKHEGKYKPKYEEKLSLLRDPSIPREKREAEEKEIKEAEKLFIENERSPQFLRTEDHGCAPIKRKQEDDGQMNKRRPMPLMPPFDRAGPSRGPPFLPPLGPPPIWGNRPMRPVGYPPFYYPNERAKPWKPIKGMGQKKYSSEMLKEANLDELSGQMRQFVFPLLTSRPFQDKGELRSEFDRLFEGFLGSCMEKFFLDLPRMKEDLFFEFQNI